MIQDIAPYTYRNEFRDRAVRGDDYCVCFFEEQILMQNIGGELIFPRFMTVCGFGTDMGAIYTEQISAEVMYLFEIDEECFYLGSEFLAAAAARYIQSGLSEGGCGCTDSRTDNAESIVLQYVPLADLKKLRPMWKAFAGITAKQLFYFVRNHTFCGCCGHRMEPSAAERAFKCPACGLIEYPRISPAVIVAVTDGERIVLTKYAGREYTRFALIAGFTEIGETLEDTVRREVMEEVGLKVKNIRYYKNQPWSFSDTLLVGFFAELDGSPQIRLDETELSAAEWTHKSEIPPQADAYDDISLTREMMDAFRNGCV